MKIITCLLLMLPLGFMHAQRVGINTSNPQATLHINGKLKFEPNLAVTPTRLVGVIETGGVKEFELADTFNITNGTLEVTESVDPNIFLMGEVNQSVTSATSQYNNYDIGLADVNQQATIIRFYGETAGFDVTGFKDGFDGRIIYFYNAQNHNVTFYDLNSASDSENQIITGSGSNEAINGTGVAEFIYDGSIQKWILINLRS